MKNVAASVHARLVNLARSAKQDVNALLDRYCAERLLYRVSRSAHAERFVLKGAQLLVVHTGAHHRPTRDIDFLDTGSADPDAMVTVIRDVCATPVDDDGVTFDTSTLRGETIRDGAEHGGVRVHVTARLGTAKVPLQMDIGFGDVITPGIVRVEFPTLLGSPAPVMNGYPLATVIAEKLEALMARGIATSLMKDLYDLWYILRHFPVAKDEIRGAIARTFAHRGTYLEPESIIFTSDFWNDGEKAKQWEAFRRRAAPDAIELGSTCQFIAAILQPLVKEAAAGT